MPCLQLLVGVRFPTLPSLYIYKITEYSDNFFLEHGNNVGKTSEGQKPTFVFPPSLKEVIRRVIPGNLADAPDPTHERVSINISLSQGNVLDLQYFRCEFFDFYFIARKIGFFFYYHCSSV